MSSLLSSTITKAILWPVSLVNPRQNWIRESWFGLVHWMDSFTESNPNPDSDMANRIRSKRVEKRKSKKRWPSIKKYPFRWWTVAPVWNAVSRATQMQSTTQMACRSVQALWHRPHSCNGWPDKHRSSAEHACASRRRDADCSLMTLHFCTIVFCFAEKNPHTKTGIIYSLLKF